jgi:hypothetical protein
MDVGRDWDIFAILLREELDDLGASEAEVDVILDRSWHRASEVESVRDFARGALELVRGGTFPYDRTEEGEPAEESAYPRERGPFDG